MYSGERDRCFRERDSLFTGGHEYRFDPADEIARHSPLASVRRNGVFQGGK